MDVTESPEDTSARKAFDMTVELLRQLNRVEHIVIEHVAALDRLAVARRNGRTLRELLSAMGGGAGGDLAVAAYRRGTGEVSAGGA